MKQSDFASAQKRLHAIVHGKVQGVFFRAHTQRKAQSLNLKGFVRNLHDGTVEVVAEGDEKALEEFHGCLFRGPDSASVEKVDVKYSAAKNEFAGFEIRY